jgi:cytidylate kinase
MSLTPLGSTAAPQAVPVITIDGPSGSGKGTVARRLAERLGWHLLDSGALYRLVAYAAQLEGIRGDDAGPYTGVAEALVVRFGATLEGHEQIWLHGNEVSTAIRSEQAGEGASRVAAMPAVRAALTERQRSFAVPPGLVADGRDMGTVIFPDAPLKIFLTASAEERARRRYNQLKDKGLGANLAALSLEIAERDRRDMNRPVAPLRPAADAIIVDSTAMSIDAVVSEALQLVAVRGLATGLT